ncbi:MAG: hypothetical protein ACRDGV_13375 [Candidatus Limnocylindria bacterium]
MGALHASATGALVAALIGFGLLAVVCAVLQRVPAWLGWLRVALVIALAAQAVAGLALFAGGARPAEWLHWVYGAVAVGSLVLADSVSEEAPSRPRAASYAAGSLVSLLMVWRLASTG